MPVGTQVNEYLLTFLAFNITETSQQYPVITEPDNWYLITPVTNTSNNDNSLYCCLYAHLISGTEPTNYTWNFSDVSGISDFYNVGGFSFRLRNVQLNENLIRPFFIRDRDFDNLSLVDSRSIGDIDGAKDSDLIISCLSISSGHGISSSGLYASGS